MLMLCRRIVELVKPLSPRPSGTVDKYTERRCRRVETDGFPARTRTTQRIRKTTFNFKDQRAAPRSAETSPGRRERAETPSRKKPDTVATMSAF